MEIIFDFAGFPLTQDIINKIIAKIRTSEDSKIDIILKNISNKGFPHLIVDYGDIIIKALGLKQ